MDTYKSARKVFWIGLSGILIFIGIICLIKNMPVKLEGDWEINNEEYIMFYDNDIAVCDGEEMTYHIIDKKTLSLDGDIYEFEITDRRNKKMIIDEKD